MAKMEPVFSRMLGSWTLPEAEPLPGASDGARTAWKISRRRDCATKGGDTSRP